MQNPIQDLIEELRASLPPIFAGPSIDELTGGAVVYRTLQNKHCAGEIPDEVFVFSGRKKLIRRDIFLAWWQTTLSDRAQSRLA